MRVPKRVGAAIGLVVAGVSLWRGCGAFERTFDFRAAGGDLARAEREYRAAGLPWTAADLAPKPPVRPEENAAPLLREAIELLNRAKLEVPIAEANPLADRGEWGRIAPELRRAEPALIKLIAASKRPRADFGRDLDLGPNVLYPELRPLKTGMQRLSLRARLRASRGDRSGAVADLVAVRRIARLVGSDGVLIGMLVRISGEAIALDGMRRVAAADPATIPALLTEIERPRAEPDFEATVRSEAYVALALVRNLKGVPLLGEDEVWKQVESDPKKLRRDGLPDGFTARGFAARSLDLWTRAAEIRRHRSDPVAQGRALQRLEEAENEKKSLSYVLNRITFPLFGKAGEAVAKERANRELTRAYLRALDAKRRTGAFPAALVGGKDPFGRAYVARREGTGFRLLSLGADGREGKNAEGESDDLVAAYPPPVRAMPKPAARR